MGSYPPGRVLSEASRGQPAAPGLADDAASRLDTPLRRAISGLPDSSNPTSREGEMKAPSSRAQGDGSLRQSGLGRLTDVTCVVWHSP